jgi:hypothetical protein
MSRSRSESESLDGDSGGWYEGEGGIPPQAGFGASVVCNVLRRLPLWPDAHAAHSSKKSAK